MQSARNFGFSESDEARLAQLGGLAEGYFRHEPTRAISVGMNWIKTLPVSDAVKFEGMFASQNIVCKLREPRTIQVLKERLGMSLE